MFLDTNLTLLSFYLYPVVNLPALTFSDPSVEAILKNIIFEKSSSSTRNKNKLNF